MGEWVDVCASSDLAEGSLMPVEAAGESLCLARHKGSVFAFADMCTHSTLSRVKVWSVGYTGRGST